MRTYKYYNATFIEIHFGCWMFAVNFLFRILWAYVIDFLNVIADWRELNASIK